MISMRGTLSSLGEHDTAEEDAEIAQLRAHVTARQEELLRFRERMAREQAMRGTSDKPGIESIPLSVAFQWNAVHRHGDDKYQNGRLGWRKEVVPLSDHINGIARHLKAISDGEMTDPDSGEKHAAHIMARAAIIIDALDHGVLKDDLNGGQ